MMHDLGMRVSDMALETCTACGCRGDSLKANVRVDDESGTEESIHGGVEGAGGKGSNGQRDEGS